MNCPCETCLVRSTCRNKLVQKGSTGRPYLIIEYAEKCPYVLEYFGFHHDKRINHSHEKINKMCEIFRVSEGEHNYFVWMACNL